MSKMLVLFRGLPGAGKTTLAENLADNQTRIFSPDDFFMIDGEYRWQADKVQDAYWDCFARTEAAMQAGADKIFIASVLPTAQKLQPFYDLGERYGYQVYSVVVEKRHANANIHHVPDEHILNGLKKFEIQLVEPRLLKDQSASGPAVLS